MVSSVLLALRKVLLIGGLVGAVTLAVSIAPAVANPITLTAISTNFNNPVGIDYHQPTNTVIVSVNYPAGTPRNFERILADGSHVPFGTIQGLTEEIKIATARTTVAGWTAGELFTGNGNDGQVDWISADGSVIKRTWDLPGSNNGLIRGSLFVDESPGSLYGNDLIVVTTLGEVWQIDSAATANCSVGCVKLGAVNTHLEGLNVIPNDALLWGQYAGKIIAGAEDEGKMYVFDNDFSTAPTTEQFIRAGAAIHIEDIDRIVPNANFFGVDFGNARILGAAASQFTSSVGHILLTEENPNNGTLNNVGLWEMYCTFTAPGNCTLQLDPFLATSGPKPLSWEHVTFSPAGIVEITQVPGVPEPASLMLLGTGLSALALRYRRRGRRN